MTDTSQAEEACGQPQTNGFADDGLDDDERGKMRPADIDADVREMERRKRVEMIMNSRLFREELERIIESQMKDGGSGPGGLLQQLSDMMGPGVGRFHSANMFRSPNCVVPINDIRGVESMGYAKGEKLLRCKLAAVYRLIDLYGWTQGIHNHITARLNQDEELFLVNPWGMLYHEVTASSLAKVDMQGNTVEGGTTNFGVNREGFKLHAAIHAARPDIKCIIHTRTSSVVAVSSVKPGLIPFCHEALVIGQASRHTYAGGIFEPEEQEKIARSLGPINKVLFLTNHGAVCCGETVEEAFFNLYNTVQACETQVKLMPVSAIYTVELQDESRKLVYDAARRPPEGHVLDKDKEVTSPTVADRKEKRWRVGGMEFEALMRMLDNAGFRTGYIYRNPLVKGDPPRPRNDIEVPPAVSSLGYLLEEEELYKQGGWKKFGKSQDRTRWLNSPNVYQKVEILETGTPDPKKITKWVDANADEWVADGSPTHSSTPVKINTLQFVPKNTNPKEFKKLQQQIKENRRADKITSGPQSHILEGVSWEEAKKMQDANISQTGDQVILVGAASKGIIQRGFQHNAMVYKAPYAKNPFDTVTEEELEEYKRAVDRKARGENYDDSESEALSSSAAAARPPTGKSPTSPTSETEEESRDEHRVVRIETKQAPRPIQAEVVLSDDSDYPDAIMERSKSARFPTKATPDLVTVPSGIGRSWSLGRNKRSNRADSQASSLPRLNTAPRHFHHARYVTLPSPVPVCEGPARPASPCPITRFSAVPEPSSRASRPIPFHYPYPSYPSLSMLSLRSSAHSISSSVDSIADDVSIPCGGSARSVIRSEVLSECVRARLTELPRAERVFVDCSKDEVSSLDVPINVKLDETAIARTRSRDGAGVSNVTAILDEKTVEAGNETFTTDVQEAGTFKRVRALVAAHAGLNIIEGQDLEQGEGEYLLYECEEHSEQLLRGVQESIFDEKDDTDIFQGKGTICEKWKEEKKGEDVSLKEHAVGGREAYADFADKKVTSENVAGEEGMRQALANVEVKGQDTARKVVDSGNVAEKMEALANVTKEEQTVAEEQSGDSARNFEKNDVIARENGINITAAGELVYGDVARKVGTGESAEEEYAVFTEDTAREEEAREHDLVQQGESAVVQEKEGTCEFVVEEDDAGNIEEEDECEDVVEEATADEEEECEADDEVELETDDEVEHEANKEEECLADEEEECEADEEEECEADKEEELETDDEVEHEANKEEECLADEEEECEADEEEECEADKEEECEADKEEECEADEELECEADEEVECEADDEEECEADDEVEHEANKEEECLADEEEECEADEEEECEADEEEECEADKEEECEPDKEEECEADEEVECEADEEVECEADEEVECEADDEEECEADDEVEHEANKEEECLADEEKECEADEEEECEADEEEEREADDEEERVMDEEEECQAGEEEECEADEEEEREADDEEERVMDEEEECQAGEEEECEADEEEQCEADEEEQCEADEEEECVADDDEEECEADEEECETADEEKCEAAEEEEREADDEEERVMDEEEECQADEEEECEADEEQECEGTAYDDDQSDDFLKDHREDLSKECVDFSVMGKNASAVARLEECAASAIQEGHDNLVPICGDPGERKYVKSVASVEDVADWKNYMSAENAFSLSKRSIKRRHDGTISKPNYGEHYWFEKKDDSCGSDKEFPAEDVDPCNDLTVVCESLGAIDKASDKHECYKQFNDLAMEAMAAAFNTTEDDEYRESFPQTGCIVLDDETITPPPKEGNLLWDFSDMTLWEEGSDDAVSFNGASESLSSSKSFHFGEGSPKVAAAFWDRGSLPCLNVDFPIAQADDTLSVTSWVDGEQYLKEEGTNSSGEAEDLEWSGAFTQDNTYDEGSWNRRNQRLAVSCGSEGGKEALFDLQDAPPSDEFFSPVSPSYLNPSTPAQSTRRRSRSVGDVVPLNTFHFSWNTSKHLPKVSVTQTVSLTGSLTNKRVDVETTVVSDREGGKCVMTKVSCSPAGDVSGRLYDSNAKSSPLELGRVFTLKNRRNIDS